MVAYGQMAKIRKQHVLSEQPTTETLLVACAGGGNLQDVMREEELAAAAARAAQPAVSDVKTAAPGATRAGGWARVAAGPTATRGTSAPASLYPLLLLS